MNTFAKVNGLSDHKGVIEVKMLSWSFHDAPDFAKFFIAIV